MQELPRRMINIWFITDGRPGHESQLRGLCERLQARATVSTKWLDASGVSASQRRPNVLEAGPDSHPDIVIAAGHRTHQRLRDIAKQYQAFSVVLMKPSLPKSLFNAIICPRHDGLNDHQRVLSTLGAINKITPPPKNQQRPLHLMLIGGPSKHFDWDESALIEQITQLCQADTSKYWLLSGSRRTPESFMSAIAALSTCELTNSTCELTNSTCELTNLQIITQDSAAAEPLEQLLVQSKETWVSPDSVSMVYESLTAGSPTAVFELRPSKLKQPSRVCRGIQYLVDITYVSTYQQWSQGHKPLPPLQVLWEADRAATWLLERFHKQQKKASSIALNAHNARQISR